MNTHPDLAFGSLAVKNGFARTSEIELALEAQKEGPAFENETPHKLGEILAEMGTLTQDQIRTVLADQTRLRSAPPTAPAELPATSSTIQFEEIAGSTLTQEAGPPLSVNGQPLTGPRTLRPGDCLQAGELRLRISGESLDVHPKGEAPPAAPAAPKLSPGARVLPMLRAADGAVARVLPALHPQRTYVLAGAAMGAVALALPWRIAANGATVLGLQGPGWPTVLLSLVPVGLVLATRATEPFTRAERFACTAASGLALLVVLWKIALPPAYATARGVGLWGSLLSTLAILAAGVFARSGGAGAPADGTPTLGARLFRGLITFAGNVSGRRARELTAALEQRDALLRKLGEAALDAHATLPEAAAAIQAREALQKAEKEGVDVRTRAADHKTKRAFAKLAQRVLESGAAPPGQDAFVADLRAVEARIRELS